MTDAKYDVLGVGNAIFDVLVQTDEGVLARHGMVKGGMALIDEARAAAIYKDMGPATEMSGGSGANTIVGVASFGARTAFIGKVKNDQIGGLYTQGGGDDDLEAAVPYGVATFGRPARSLTLGFAVAFTPEDVPQFDERDYYVGSTRRWRSEPILMVGGEAAMGRRLAFVTENWLFLDRPLSEQAFGLALRFFSGRISVDAGFVFVPEILEEGFPLPWLSFSYHFGPSRSAAKRPNIFDRFRTSMPIKLARPHEWRCRSAMVLTTSVTSASDVRIEATANAAWNWYSL